ncbi:MAG: ABC transporter permease [Armatimonadetes bacterium]|nr:ABC transporter permease [Armatimonadota bacterium]
MGSFVIRRLLILIPVLVGISFLVFSAMYLLPGDAIDSLLAETGGSTRDIERLRKEFGLDQPFLVQYGTFLSRAVRGDFGMSLRQRIPVKGAIKDQMGATIELTLAALVISIGMGIGLGVVAAIRRGTWIDTTAMFISLIGVSMPIFWSGLLLIFLFSLRLGWLPAAGTGGFAALILPAVTLGFSAAAIIARVTRSSLLDVLGQDYVRTARAKGLGNRVVVWGHAMRNALVTVVTIVGLQFGGLLGGAVVVETVFGRQGIGFLAADAIRQQDFPMVQGTVLVSTLAFVLVNLAVDIVYGFVDPRIRYA